MRWIYWCLSDSDKIRQESRAIAWRTARCRCKFLYVSKFTATSRGFRCNSTEFEFLFKKIGKIIDFGTKWKRVCDFLLVRHTNLGPMLPRFRDIAGFLLINWPPSLFHPNFGVFLLDQIADIGVSLSRNLKPWNYFRSIPTYSNQVLCDQRTWTLQTDRQTNSQTDGRQNCVCGMTALCVASCDENRKVATKCFRVESKIPSCRRKTSAHAFRYYPAVYIH